MKPDFSILIPCQAVDLPPGNNIDAVELRFDYHKGNVHIVNMIAGDKEYLLFTDDLKKILEFLNSLPNVNAETNG